MKDEADSILGSAVERRKPCAAGRPECESVQQGPASHRVGDFRCGQCGEGMAAPRRTLTAQPSLPSAAGVDRPPAGEGELLGRRIGLQTNTVDVRESRMEIRRVSASQCWPAGQSPAPLGGTGGQDGRATGAAAYVGSGPRRSGRPTWSVPRPLVGGSARSRHHGSIRPGRPGCGRGGARGQESRLSQPYWPEDHHGKDRVAAPVLGRPTVLLLDCIVGLGWSSRPRVCFPAPLCVGRPDPGACDHTAGHGRSVSGRRWSCVPVRGSTSGEMPRYGTVVGWAGASGCARRLHQTI